MAAGKRNGHKARRRGKWVLDFLDQHGKRCWETTDLEGTDENEPEAEVRLRMRLREVEAGIYLSKRELKQRTVVRPATRFEELAQHFLDHLDVRDFTRADYKGLIDTHILPKFGSKRLSEINNQMITEFTRGLRQTKVKSANRLLSRNRVNMVLTRLKQIFNYAADQGWIDHIPRIKNVRDEKDDAGDVLTPEECMRLVAAAAELPDLRNRLLFKFALLTGMRQGEILGLEWRDIDFESGWIPKILHTARQRKKNRPKSKSSKQGVMLPATLVAQLEVWKESCPKAPPDADHGNLVFPNAAGNFDDPRNLIRRGLYPLLAQIGISEQERRERKINFHTLRKTHSTLLVAAGVDPKSVQRRMRHSSSQMTMDVYTRTRRNSEDVCVAALDQLFAGSTPVASSPQQLIERLPTHDSGRAEEALEAVEEASEVL